MEHVTGNEKLIDQEEIQLNSTCTTVQLEVDEEEEDEELRQMER